MNQDFPVCFFLCKEIRFFCRKDSFFSKKTGRNWQNIKGKLFLQTFLTIKTFFLQKIPLKTCAI